MLEPNEGDAALACAWALVDELWHRGALGACLSPGSRSTPLALALARHGRIAIHVHLDERSSAFFALGLAKATGRPAIVVTTSGTAVANLLPAVVEAAMSGTPMVLLTADRPPELRGTGANQTIDQVGIFGSYPRLALDASPPEATPGAAEGWRRLAAQAMSAALGPPGGPAHLNLPFREPLVPASPWTPGSAAEGTGAEPGRGLSVPAGRAPMEADVDALAELVRTTPHGIVLAGGGGGAPDGMAAEGLAGWAARGPWPLLAEPHSGARAAGRSLVAAVHLLGDPAFVEAHAPAVALQLGAPPIGRAAQSLLTRVDTLVVVAPGAARADPSGRAAIHVDADPGTLMRELVRRLPEHGDPDVWLRTWRAADAAARAAADAVLDASDEPFEGRVARDLFAALPDGAILFAGSSMPIRDLDAYAIPRPGGAVRVIANRGASGIDGSVSTALGIAAAGEGPVVALLGDLTLLHDAGALLWSARRGQDAVFVVPNNHGGGIFDHLAIAAEPEHERLFVTPHSIDLGALAATAGAGYERVERAGRLVDGVTAAVGRRGVHVIEIPIDRSEGLRTRWRVREAVHDALRPG